MAPPEKQSMNIIDRDLAVSHTPKDRDLSIVIKSLISKFPRPKGAINTILASEFDRDQIKIAVDRLLQSGELVERSIGTQIYLYTAEKVAQQHQPIAKKQAKRAAKPTNLSSSLGDVSESAVRITQRLEGLKSYRQKLIDQTDHTIARYRSERRPIAEIKAYTDRMRSDLGGIDAAIESSTAKLKRLEVRQSCVSNALLTRREETP